MMINLCDVEDSPLSRDDLSEMVESNSEPESVPKWVADRMTDVDYAVFTTVLGHPYEAPSLLELQFMNPSLSAEELQESLCQLHCKGMVESVTPESENRPEGLPASLVPRLFVQLTDVGESAIEILGLNSEKSELKRAYHLVLKPEVVLRHEAHSR